MDAAANYPQRAVQAEPLLPRRPCRIGHRRALLGLLGTIGVLAFVFSAASPGDDDIQQELFQSSKSRQCFLANYKTVSSLRTFRICTVRSALAPPTQQLASFYVTARVSVPDDEIKVRVCSSSTGDRSPPTKSS
jgi:hypothetical protein